MHDFRLYVAIGDSTTEGLFDPDGAGGNRGWADRLAEHLARHRPGLLYANLAVRGRRTREIRTEQLEPALAFDPELVSVVAGMNDILRPSFDLRAVLADLDQMVLDGLHVLRLAVGREAHQLVLAGVHLEPGVVGERAVEEAERVREPHLAQHVELMASAYADRRGRPLADAVDRQHRRLFERRWIEGRGGVRFVMLAKQDLARVALEMAGDFVDRFAPPGYHSDDPGFKTDFEAQCRRTKAAGIDAIEIHQHLFEKSLNGDLDWPAVERAKKELLPELGLTITACNINTWTNPRFRLGGVCNPDPALRRAAQEEVKKAIEIAKALSIPVVSVWPGSDGADYHFQIDYRQSLDWFTEALMAANRECQKAGILLAMEPKPYEPRELYMIIPTAASAILVAQRVNQATGGSNCGLTIDYGHQKMEATTASTACDLADYAGVPVHKFDINDARQGRNDQDCMFGTLSLPESVEYLFTTFVRNYQGYYSQDQFTYRDDPTRAMERSMINFANLALKAVRLYAQREQLDKARAAGTGPDILDVVSPVLVG